MPTFHRTAAKDDRVKSKYVVPEVVGEIIAGDLAHFIEDACAKQNKKAAVQQVHLGPLATADRAASLSKNGNILHS